MYGDVRNLSEWGVIVRENGSVDVSRMLECKERYESVGVYAKIVFQRRRAMLKGG